MSIVHSIKTLITATLSVFFKSPVWVWIIIFVGTNVFFPVGRGGTNPMSRYATMRAMGDHTSFRIDEYKSWTIDWSLGPDGHYYSNKAPGPMFIGFPLFYILDRFDRSDPMKLTNSGARLSPPGYIQTAVLCLLTQVIPFSILVLLACSILRSRSIPLGGIHFSALAMLFGNTADLFFNVYFGHGMTAIFLLAACLAHLKRNSFWVGLFFGFALLTEYTAGLFLPLFLFVQFRQNKNSLRWLVHFMLGGMLPGMLWLWYHISCFGGPFEVSNKYLNPALNEPVSSDGLNVWGIFIIKLHLDVMYELLFGPSRGILMTQPWVLLVALFSLVCLIRKEAAAEAIDLVLIGCIGFFLLFLLNQSFVGWHGGHTSGPRYLSPIFPVLGFMGGFFYSRIPKYKRSLLWLTLLFSIVFRGMVHGGTFVAHDGEPIWGFVWDRLKEFPHCGGYLRMIGFYLVLSIGGTYAYLRPDLRAHDS